MAAVFGDADNDPNPGFIAIGVGGIGPIGVVGTARVNGVGVLGLCDPPNVQGAGVRGHANEIGSNFDPVTGGNGVHGIGYIGVRGQSQNGVAILGQTTGSAKAGKFEGDVDVKGNSTFEGNILVVGGPIDVFEGDINVTGSVSVTNDLFLKNRGDVAERFEVDATAHYHPGMLMVIGENGALEPCTCAYDKRAIGVISGAGALRPAVTLGAFESQAVTVPIALVGTVFCLVDATQGPVKAGDLVTTSETPGHAMTATDPVKSFGAIVGKALAPLREGRGLIPIVIALQ
jgi:hypothetical protein